MKAKDCSVRASKTTQQKLSLTVIILVYLSEPSTRIFLSLDHGNTHHASIPFDPYEHIKVGCVGTNATKLTLKQDGAKLETESPNDSTIQIIGSPGGTALKYVCTDFETNCETWASISIIPSIDVSLVPTSENDFSAYFQKFITEYGSHVTVKCSGPTGSPLILTKDSEELETYNVIDEYNQHANIIEWFARKPDLQISNYTCFDAHTNVSNSEIITVKPAIYVQTENKIMRGYDMLKHDYRLTYGSIIEIFCTAPRAVKLFTVEEGLLHEEILTEKVNDTTVKAVKTNMETGTSLIACVDKEVPIYMNTMRLKVTPQMNVLSPEIRYVSGQSIYYIKYGVPFEIVCSGCDARQLTTKRCFGKRLNELNYIVNVTTIKWYIKDADVTDTYICQDGELQSRVTVHALPNVLNFRCMSYDLEYLKCSWSSLAYYRELIYTLFYMEQGNTVHVCTKLEYYGKIISETRTHSCVWNYPSDIKEFSFLMQSCNKLVGCFNQTFLIEHLSIIKPGPPAGLTREPSLNPGAVFLLWDKDPDDESSFSFLYKVVYSYPDIQPVEVNSSLVLCHEVYCSLELELFCPNQFYTIKVYRKLETAVGEEYWSDLSSITVYSDFVNADKNIDLKCYLEVTETNEMMVHSTHKLNNDVNLEMRKIGGKVGSLKDKRSLIHAYIKQLSKTDEK